VNDVAAINIDAGLIAVKAGEAVGGAAAQGDTVEMSNGCACCSAAEELLGSIEKLAEIAEKRDTPWDHIVIETSGVAEPREVRDNLGACFADQPELMRGTRLHTLVTVIDSSTFLGEFQKRNKVEQRADLGASEFTDGNRQVVDLMCEQIECADILIANKRDLVSDAEAALLAEALATLNPLAKVHTAERSQVDLAAVLAAAGEDGVARSDEDDDMRRVVRKIQEGEASAAAASHDHGHAEAHAHGHGEACDEGCADKAHGHEHAHQEHAHEHGHAEESHGHGHGHADAPAAAVAHDHDHADAGRHSTRFGITSFVYQRRRPFHPHRLMAVIRNLPVRQEKLALADALREPTAGGAAGGAPAAADASPLHALIRSKGFVWLSNSHPQMFTWALAGKHFELKQYASWWSCVPREEWPEDPAEVQTLERDFAGEFGDHRQELVFIGVRMDKAAIIKAFDDCLLNDSEMEAYRKHWS
jgi:G3E family GTPase